MGALIQYFGIGAKRRRKETEELRAEAEKENLAESGHDHYWNTCPKCDSKSTCRCSSDRKVQTHDLCDTCRIAAESITESVVQEAEITESSSDFIGVWLLPEKQEYIKVPIQPEYFINKKTKIQTFSGRTHLPSLALLGTWKKLIKNAPAFRNTLPKDSAKHFTSGDMGEITNVAHEVEKNFLAKGAAYYLMKDGEGQFICRSDIIPHLWDHFITELNGKSVGEPMSIRLPKPLKISVLYGHRSISFPFDEVAKFAHDYTIKTFTQLSQKTKGEVETVSAVPTMGGSAPPPEQVEPKETGRSKEPTKVPPSVAPPKTSPTKFFDTLPSNVTLSWLASNLPVKIKEFLSTKWGDGTYSQELEYNVIDEIEGYLEEIKGKVDHISTKARESGYTLKTRKEIFDISQKSGELISIVSDILKRWNDLFHKGKRDDWSNSKYALSLKENVTVDQLNGILTEMTFRRLMDLTQQNGEYTNGGMVKIGNTWVTDPRVKGRFQNSYFVVVRPPVYTTDTDGLVRLNFNFKSKPDRSTTGMRQKGYIKFVPPSFLKRVIKKVVGFFKKQKDPVEGWSSEVHVFCTCPDFKYRWHKVLADAGASHTPSGMNGEATNVNPTITNPSRKLSLCKHLIAMSGYLAKTQGDASTWLKAKGEMKNLTPTGVNMEPKVNSGASVDT